MTPSDDPSWRRRTRNAAGMLLFAGAAFVALTIRAYVAGGQLLTFGVVFGPALALLGLSGLIEPPSLYAFGPRRPHLTSRQRFLGTLAGVIGVAIGLATWILLTVVR